MPHVLPNAHNAKPRYLLICKVYIGIVSSEVAVTWYGVGMRFRYPVPAKTRIRQNRIQKSLFSRIQETQ